MATERSMPGDWQNLLCDCGSDRFAQVVRLRWKTGGGTTPQHWGYKCSICGLEADSEYLIRKAEVTRKRQELKEVQAELDAVDARTAKK